MKKTLLSMAAMMLLATGVNAQKLFDSKVAQKADLVKHNKVELNVASTSIVNHNGMKKADEETNNKILLGYQPTKSTTVAFAGWPSIADASGVAAQMSVPEEGYGYKVVGVRFAVVASLGEATDEDQLVGAFVYALPSDKNATQPVAVNFKDLPEDSYDLCEVGATEVNVNFNDVYFTNSFTLDDTMSSLMWGLFYVQKTDDSDDSYPILLAKYGDDEEFPTVDEDNCPFLAYGSFSSKGLNWYAGSDAEKSPYALVAYLICETPSGETAIVGLNNSKKPVAQQYYTVDGKRLSAPQKGLNIVKLSNGETQKVYVK